MPKAEGLHRRSLAAVILAMAMVHLIYSITVPLLALVLERQGISAGVIGFNTAVQALAVILIGPLVPRILRRLGPTRLMTASLLTAAVVMIALKALPQVEIWFVLRFLLGVCAAGMWIASEAWINALAEPRARGRVIGLYATAGSVGLTLGPLLLALTGSEGWLPFLVTAGLLILACLPIAMADNKDRAVFGDSGVSSGLTRLFLLAPLPFLLCFAVAAGDEALWTFFPLFGQGFGLAEAETLLLLTVAGLGGIALQWPVGWLADNYPRRWILLLVLVLCLACIVLLGWVTPIWPANLVVLFLMGGLFGSLYTLGLVILGETFVGGQLTRATALFSMLWGVGAFAGPAFAGLGLELWRPYGFIVVLAAILVPCFATARQAER